MPSSSASEVIAKVEKATNHLLIAPDWTMNMEICDAINSNQWQRKDVAKDVVKAVKKRIQHKKPTVQFFALTLLETMMKNCGDLIHFHVIDREILQEMSKIVRKRTDIQVRNKILTLLDAWQEAFGGPNGKHPEYYFVYAELKKSGVDFPPHSGDAAPIFTPPVTHPVGYGSQNDSTLRLEEAMSSEMGDLRLSDLDSIRRVAELLEDMLQAVNSNDCEAVKDELIVDLVNQCRVNQKKVIHWITSTRDEEMLAEALELNDNLQYLIAKHDAIASGSEPPIKESVPTPSSDHVPPTTEPQKNKQIEEDRKDEEKEEEEEEDDGFAQLARRKSKINTNHQYIGSTSGSDVPISTTCTSTTEAASSSPGNALVLSEYPDSANTTTKTKDQDMIDLLSLALTTTDSSPSPTQVQDHSQRPQQPDQIPQQITANQGYAPSPYANSYVAPWAQPVLPPPQQQQPQYPQYSYSAYPPPPWASSSEDTMHGPSPLIRHNTFSAEANRGLGSRQLHHQSSVGSRGITGGAQGGGASKPYIPSYRLFEDLIDLDGGMSTKNTDSSGQQKSMVSGGRK